MIRFAEENGGQEVWGLGTECRSLKEKRFLEYYFNNEFKDARVLVSELDHLLVSQVHLREHDLCLSQKRLRVSFLYAIATHYDYRQRGIMRDLITMTLEDCAKNYLLTFLEASNPKLFERYGFDVISYRSRYIVYAKELMHYASVGVSKDFSAKELVNAYKEFSKRFDCYYHRDEKYYEHYIKRIQEEKGHFCVYRDEEGVLTGYALYYVRIMRKCIRS